MLPIERDILPAQPLQLRDRERRRRQRQRHRRRFLAFVSVVVGGKGKDAAAFAGMIALPGQNGAEDFLGSLVEFVEIVGGRGWGLFFPRVRRGCI